ncbi:hypothetical protein GNZ13_21680 [Paraburkholderia sp. 5N]|uniref:Thiolase C-terminal domain-containing protein n=2 Tax=Paraburkholderia elongata TaxID=2675747 RepID=A0A972NP24_9BURK|nr:hypothetical protein [Paraburkholderia elongata]NPT57116.1 hypothetical protein [Paraburkholderia elongata]
MNVRGCVNALGHPLGASGPNRMITVVHGLRRRRGRFSFQAMCEEGGVTNVTFVE